MTSYDVIIAGGGVAGLSLAHHLVHSPLRDRSILIVDRDRETCTDRALSFWADGPTGFEGAEYRTWDRLRVAGPGFESTAALDGYRYAMIRGADFCRFTHAALADCPNVDFVQGTVGAISEGEGGACVTVGAQDGAPATFRGQWVFDSRFSAAEFAAPLARARSFRQYFLGWEIETETDAFDPQVPVFMDFRPPQRDGITFGYVLPFSARRALVEYVQMSRSPAAYGPLLKSYIESTLGIDRYQIHAREGGASPITDWAFPRRAGRHTMTIGTRGGRIKPSSGYAFTRIQRDSAAIVRSLLTSGHPFDVPRDPRFYRLCDALMLRVLDQRAEWLVPLFATLFARNPIERVFRFLDEQASPAANARLTLSLLPDVIGQMLARPAATPIRKRMLAQGE